MSSKNDRIIYLIITILVILNIVFWNEALKIENRLEVVFFDVGQGDSIFINLPTGKAGTLGNIQILIDGGPDSTVLEKLGQEMLFYDRTIDLIVLTHPDKDHLRGLLEVLKSYNVLNIMWTGTIKDTADYLEWVRLIEEEQANIIIAESGQRIDLSDDIYLSIHNPISSIEGDNIKLINDTSIVIELVHNNISFLFTGDISKKIEKQLDIDSDILQIAHHGSKTSTSREFLESVAPELAIISVGKNSYGHPTDIVLQNIAQFGINLLTTIEYGDIRIISNGNNFIIK